ncbi:MAG TPA: tRNA pseudouridine(38-40) synthase TruA [Alphaproteobacteria bacterium]|nr:tRNA pseudouridine(38-40) synthase TruA [Alphaproteobacteria bacterium]
MQRFKLTVEYDGRPFAGWQRQDNGPSVQQALEEAAARLDGRPVAVTGAGRTDAGVHATGQVAHLDLEKPLRPDQVRDALNFHLRPAAVAVLRAEAAAPDFHARFSCLGRAYRYRIVNRRAPLTFEAGLAWQVNRPLDAGAMAAAAAHLVGRHDFSSFRAAECQAASPVRMLDRLEVRREGECVVVEAAARSFLHNQVRIMVGTLAEVGLGRRRPEWVAEALAARSRAAAGRTAPPDGLTFTAAFYPSGGDEQAVQPFAEADGQDDVEHGE